MHEALNKWTSPSDLEKKVSVYTTGSFGRDDASTHSDLDTFIISLNETATERRLLTNLEEIELAASIVSTNRALGLPELDGDGGYLKAHSMNEYLVGLGKPSDDANNTFTGRLLLLLESQPIFGQDVYEEIIGECINRYWIDYSDHSESFIPAFLLNDILRFWRTLCINYEAGTTIIPEKRRAKNFKLKYSRLLTCYSAIIGIQVRLRECETVDQANAREIVGMRPLERIELARAHSSADKVDNIVRMYEAFLQETDCTKEELYEKMRNADYYKTNLEGARQFGDEIFQLIASLASADEFGSQSWRFLRYITV